MVSCQQCCSFWQVLFIIAYTTVASAISGAWHRSCPDIPRLCLSPYWMAVCGALGILLGAAYFLWTLQRMFFGAVNLKGGEVWHTALADLNLREKITLLPLAVIVLALGLMPSLVFDKINDSVLG